MRDLTRATLVHQHQRLARRDSPVIRIATAAVVTGGAFLYVILCLRKPGEPLTRILRGNERRKHATRNHNHQTFHGCPPSRRILSQESGSTDTLVCARRRCALKGLLASPWSFANLLQKVAQAECVARRSAIARIGIDTREFADRRCERRRLHADSKFQRCLRRAPRKTMALELPQEFGIK